MNEEKLTDSGAGATVPSTVDGAGDKTDIPGSDGRSDGVQGSRQNLDVVLDIPVQLSMELGRARIAIGELLKLDQGSVVELERSVDEPMDIFVNGTLVARGEAVVVDEKFGVRLTDVISPMERFNKAT